MRINWDLLNPAKPPPATRLWSRLKRALARKPVPMHMSNHYNADHFKAGADV